jgi:hypothetical protein
MKKKYVLLVIGFCTLNAFAQTSDLTLTSGNSELETHFNWAKNRALSLVITGKADYTETAFWGSYAHDKAYCIRDITHQSEAGHLLGLGNENFYMMKQFAKSTKNPTTSQKNWVSWKFNFYGKEERFTRELPSPFDAVQRCYENYLWSGDSRWINDPELNYFYNLTLGTNVNEYDVAVPGVSIDPSLLGNGVVGITDSQDGLASYYEFQNEKLYEAGDSFGSQYQATLAYAEILKVQGKTTESNAMFATAVKLKKYFETKWYSNTQRRYIRGFESNGQAQTNWGHENSLFLVLKKLIEQGTDKGQDYIDFVHVSTMNDPINIEAQTYYAEAFYNNEQNYLGWHWLLNVMRSRDIYPEVAYMCVYNTIGGLVGVRADAPNNKFFTIPRLTKAVPWVEVDHIPVGNKNVKVRHDGATSSTATNNSASPILWEAQFYGSHNQLIVAGVSKPAQQKQLNGTTISFVSVTLNANTPITVTVPASAPADFVYLTDMIPTNTTGSIYPETNSESLILMVRDTYFTKGFSTRTGTEVSYNVAGNSLFKAKVGVDRKTGGTMNFQVWGDGKKLYETGNMSEKEEYKPISVNIVGVSTLKLIAVGSGGVVSADWADAGIAKKANADFILEYVSMTDNGNSDGLADPGETINLKVKITNSGVIESGNIDFGCSAWANDPSYITITGGTENIGKLAVGASVEKVISATINANTPRELPLEFTFIANDGSAKGSVVKTLVTPFPVFSFKYNGIGTETSEDGELSSGETASFDLSVENKGNGISKSIKATCQVITGAQYVDITASESSKIISAVVPGAISNFSHTIKVKDDVLGGTELKFKFVIDDGIDKTEIIKQYFTTKPDFSINFGKLEGKKSLKPLVEANSQTDYTVQILNAGNGSSTANTTVTVTAIGINASVVTINTPTFQTGSLLAKSQIDKIINFSVNSNAKKDDVIELKIVVNDGMYSNTKTQKFIVGDVCLSDMPFLYNQGSYSEVFRDSRVMGASPISLGGVVYAKGLGVHAVRTIHIALNEEYSRFTAIVGIDDGIVGSGSVKFNIYDQNNVSLYKSGLLEGNANGVNRTESIDIDVTKVKTLKLEVTDGDFNGINSDHADWGNPQLTLKDTKLPIPATPSNLVATANSGSLQAGLIWQDNATNETGYSLERAVGNGSYNVIAALGSDTVSYTDIGLVAGTTYFYRVRANGGSVYSDYSNVATATIASVFVAAPVASANGVYSDAFYSYWGNAIAGTTYEVQLFTNGAWTTFGTSTTHYLYIPKQGSTTDYTFRVRAITSSGTSDWSNVVAVSLGVVVKAPSNLVSTANSGALLAELSWNDNASNEIGYSIERAVGNGVYSVIATLGSNAVSYTDTGLVRGTTYSYRVRANAGSTYSDYSNIATATIASVFVAAPNASANGVYANGFYSYWGGVIAGTTYEVQLYTSGAWTTSGISDTYYLYIPKQGSTINYRFRVRAITASGSSDWSNVVDVILPVSQQEQQLGVNELNADTKKQGFVLYPNPGSGIVNFSFNSESVLTGTVYIYDTFGKLVDVIKNQSSYTVSNLPKGMYLVKLVNNSIEETKTLIVE